MRARDMTLRPIVSLALASAAVAAAAPAWSQSGDPEIVYEQEAVIQPLPGEIPPETTRETVPLVEQGITPEAQRIEYESEFPAEYGSSRSVEQSYSAAPYSEQAYPPIARPGPMLPPYAAEAPVYFPHANYPGAMPYPSGYQHDQNSRGQWLAECRARYDGGDGRGKQRGRTIGALVGAAAGGLIGNRVAGRGDRLVGTVIGAGVGGLAGAAAGSAIGESSDRREALDECEAFLLQHEAQWQSPGYGYRPMMLVPIMIPVEQRAVVREYVTEEWVDEEVIGEAPGKAVRSIARPEPVKTAPAGSKTVRVKSGR